MEQTETLPSQAMGTRRQFLLRSLLLVLLFAPFAYLGMLVSVAIHEVVGHGLTTVCLGGQFLGFCMNLKGIGYASIPLPLDAPAWKLQAGLAGGMISTFLVGACLLCVAARVRGVVLAFILLILSATFLLEGSAYLFWNSVSPVPAGDPGRILANAHSPWLRPVFIAVGAIGMFGTIAIILAMLFRRLEAWLGDDGRLSGARRVLILALLGLLPAPFFFLEDWEPLVPGIGLLPAIVGSASFLAVAAGLYWISFRPRPRIVRKRNIGIALAAGWTSVVLAVAVTVLWLQNGLAIGHQPETPIHMIGDIAVSPDRQKSAFFVIRGASGGPNPWLDTRLHLWPVDGKAVATDILGFAGLDMAWSPGSLAIAYLSVPDTANGFTIRLMQVTIADTKTTVLAEGLCFSHCYSPDGKWIAFAERDPASTQTHFRANLKALEIETGKIVTLATAIESLHLSWCWTRDSSGVVFLRRQAMVRRPLADGPEEVLYTSSAGDEHIPCSLELSPDGQSLAFFDGNTLRILNLKDLSVRDVVSDRQFSFGLDWSPDGICYVEHQQGTPMAQSVLKVCDPSTGQSRAVVAGHVSSPCWLTGNRILVRRGKETLWVYDAATGDGREIFSLAGENGPQP